MKVIHMKKQILLIMALALLLIALPAEATTIRPNLLVTNFKIKEGAAQVGKDFTLSVTLQNIEPQACAYRVVATVSAGFPFIQRGVSTVEAADLCKGAVTSVDFPMRIDPTAVGGTYQLTINSNYETVTNAPFSSSNVINIFVEGTPDINAYIINSDPIDTYAGDTATITVNVENDGSFPAQAVKMELSANTPLEVKWAKSFSSIGMLDAKASKTADFSVEIPKNAKADKYPMKLTATYLDEKMQEQTKEYTLMFTVKKKALFDTSEAGSETLYADKAGMHVKLTMTNTGSDTAYKLKAKLLPQYPFSTDGSVRYVDALAPGKSATIEMLMDIDKSATPGTYGLDILVDYEDAQGKSMQDTAKASFTIESKSLLRAVLIDYWFVWLIIILVGVVIIRKKMGGKRKKE